MNKSILKELAQYVHDDIGDRLGCEREDLHFHLFNEYYYIIGYYQAKQWLKMHDVDAFECIEHVMNYEEDNFGASNTSVNSESMVNMLCYIIGEEILGGIDVGEGLVDEEFIAEVKEYLVGEYDL